MNQRFIIVASAAVIAAGTFARQARAAALPECEPPPQVETCDTGDGGSCPSDFAGYCAALNPNPEFCVYSEDLSTCDADGCTSGKFGTIVGADVVCTYVRGPS